MQNEKINAIAQKIQNRNIAELSSISILDVLGMELVCECLNPYGDVWQIHRGGDDACYVTKVFDPYGACIEESTIYFKDDLQSCKDFIKYKIIMETEEHLKYLIANI